MRPASFFENLAPQITGAVDGAVIADTIEASFPMPMVGAVDVAAAAVHALVDPGWHGTVMKELLGPGDITHAEIAEVVAKVLGLSRVSYVRVPPAR